MQRFRGFIALFFSLLLTFTPAMAGPRNTAELKENGRGPARESARLAQQAAQELAIAEVSVRVGDSLPINNVIVVVKAGEVRTQRNCAHQESWPPGHAYPSPGPAVVTNEGRQVADLIVVSLNAARKYPAVCGTAFSARSVELSRGVAEADAILDIEAGKQIVVQSYVVQPGFNFLWHQHPGSTLVVEQEGTMTEYFACGVTKVWEPGYVYHHHAGHHGHGKKTVKNEGDQAAVFMAVYFNVWEWHPAPLVPGSVEPPPAECPTASLV
jgi:quercetin dioxygenase-like cupin family protein